MLRRHLVPLVLWLGLTPTVVHSGELELQNAGPIPGQVAPPLVTSQWVRGAPIESFQPGRVYVVDLWSSWCKPCITSMPHLSRIARRYGKDLTIIAMNIWEMQPKKVPSLVESMGDSIVDFVAMDRVPPEKEANEGLTAVAYLGTSDMVSVPRTFLIDRDGRLAWIGTPDGLEGPLAQVIEGRWDIQPFATKYCAELKQDLRYRALLALVETAVVDSSWERAYEASENVVEADSLFAARIANQGFEYIAMTILGLKTAGTKELEIGRRAAERALQLNPDPDWSMYQVAARTSLAAGDRGAARRHLERAIETSTDADRTKLQEELKALEPED